MQAHGEERGSIEDIVKSSLSVCGNGRQEQIVNHVSNSYHSVAEESILQGTLAWWKTDQKAQRSPPEHAYKVNDIVKRRIDASRSRINPIPLFTVQTPALSIRMFHLEDRVDDIPTNRSTSTENGRITQPAES